MTASLKSALLHMNIQISLQYVFFVSIRCSNFSGQEEKFDTMSDRRNVNSTEFSTFNKVALGAGLGIAASAIIGTIFSNDNNSTDTSGSKNQQKQSPPMLQTKSKTKQSREDTNPNAVLKQITANNIKMNRADMSKSNKIVEQVSSWLHKYYLSM